MVIYDVWKQTSDARSFLALDENIAVICVPANRRKDPRNPEGAEVAAGRYSSRIIVYGTDSDIASKINVACD